MSSYNITLVEDSSGNHIWSNERIDEAIKARYADWNRYIFKVRTYMYKQIAKLELGQHIVDDAYLGKYKAKNIKYKSQKPKKTDKEEYARRKDKMKVPKRKYTRRAIKPAQENRPESPYILDPETYWLDHGLDESWISEL